MLAGRNTFINDILAKNGLTNVIKADRYPEIKVEEILADIYNWLKNNESSLQNILK